MQLKFSRRSPSEWRALPGYRVMAAATLMCMVSAAPSWGVLIRNVTTGDTLFYDNFEGVDAIGVGYPDDLNTTDFDPVATVGTWSTVEDSVSQIQVTDFDGTATGGVAYPGAWQGDNYMWLNRTNA